MSDSAIDQIRNEARKYLATRQLIESSTKLVRGERTVRTGIDETAQKFPRWQSGVRKLDEDFGGFYGVTLVGATPGIGKSTLALGSSLLAAESGLCVVYFDAENDLELVSTRMARWYGEHEISGAVERLAGYWHRVEVYPGAELDELIFEVLRCFEPRHKGLLIVLDSLNTLAEYDARTAQDTFDAMRRLLFWLDGMVRRSHGFISALALSELNAVGELKGRKSGHTAQLVVRLEAEDDDDEVVRIKITKSRAGRAGDLGLFRRDWRTGRFDPPSLAS